MTRILVATAVVVLGSLSIWAHQSLWAHQGDPKFKVRNPYRGAGYRLGGDPGTNPLGPMPFASDGVTLLSWLPLDDFGTGIQNGNDCWGYVSGSGREYAIFGHYSGTAFVEITDPTNPEIIEQIDGADSLWRDIKIYQDYAYSVNENSGGIQVIDLSGIDSGVVSLVGNVVTGGTEASHNVVIDEVSGFLYRAGGSSNGLRIYDLTNPAAPSFVTSWADRYVHDAQVVTYDSGPYAGMQVAFCCSGFNGGWVETGIDILDVTDKSDIQLLARYEYSDGEYSHQAWLSEDRQYLFLNDELDEGTLGIPTETKVIDVSDLTNPLEVDEFTNGSSAVGHNVYVQGNVLFEANYRSGLRIFDISDPLNAFETAWFDTYPEDDNVGYDGLWSVYPYFPSGTVIGSDINRGLFVFHVGEIPLAFEYPDGLPDLLDPSGATFPVQIVEQGGATLAPSTASLHFDAGSGFEQVALAPLGGLFFEANFPPLPCGSTVQFYLSASTTDDFEVTDPLLAPSNGVYVGQAAIAEVATFFDDFETDTGWTVGDPNDDATTGVWERVDPNGTAAQPEDDHSDPGTLCWVTGQGAVGGAQGDNDVDGGQTTLTSPALDTAGLSDPRIRYWRWFSNSGGSNPGQDVFTVDISDDDGQSWTNLEVVGPTGSGTNGGWFLHEARVTDFVTPTSTIRLRFVAEDLDGGSIIEAAIDDLTVVDLACEDCNDNGVDDFTDIATGTSEDCNSNGIPDECDIEDGTSLDANLNGVPDECECPQFFIRGDVDNNGTLGLPDAIALLTYLFVNGPDPDPLDAGDVNGDFGLDISDATFLLQFLFAMGAPPPAPFPEPGCP